MIYLKKVRQIVVAGLLLTVPLWLPALSAYCGEFHKEVPVLLEKLQTKEVKDAVNENASALKRKGDNIAAWSNRTEAIRFFYDIKAKRLLLVLLEGDDWSIKGHLTSQCLDLFRIEDMIAIYDIAVKAAPKLISDAGFGQELAKRYGLINGLQRRTVAILSLQGRIDMRFTDPDTVVGTPKHVRAWWLKALRTAKQKGTYQSPLDAALKYFEQEQKPVKTPHLKKPVAGNGSDAKVGQRKINKVEIAIEALVKRLHSKNLKRMVQEHAKLFKVKDTEKHEKAMLFFADIKAKGVLLALLASKDRDAHGYVIHHLMDRFTIDEVVGLYQAALAHARTPPFLNGDAAARQQWVVLKIALRTSKILRLKPGFPKTNAPTDIRNWWWQALRTAKANERGPSPLDRVLQALEKGAAVGRKR